MTVKIAAQSPTPSDATWTYAMLVKLYGRGEEGREAARRYSPSKLIEAAKTPIIGNPDPAHISTSFVERQNLTMRMSMRRFTRLTNAFSKKLENHTAAVSLHFAYYNLCRPHKTRRASDGRRASCTHEAWAVQEACGRIAVGSRLASP